MHLCFTPLQSIRFARNVVAIPLKIVDAKRLASFPLKGGS